MYDSILSTEYNFISSKSISKIYIFLYISHNVVSSMPRHERYSNSQL